MPTETTWHAIARVYPRQPLTGDQVAELNRTIPEGYALSQIGDRLQFGLTVTASTMRAAFAAAERATIALNLGTLAGIHIQTMADFDRDLERPASVKLVGLTEVAAELRVSKQRAAEIASTNPDFPPPLGRPAMGPIYTEDSVKAFAERWPRRRTGRPPKTAA